MLCQSSCVTRIMRGITAICTYPCACFFVERIDSPNAFPIPNYAGIKLINSQIHARNLPGPVERDTSVHQGLIGSLVSKIMGQLWKIRDTHDSAAVLLEKINWMGSTSIRLEDGVRHDPDGQFRHQDARYPGEVIEVANTQQKKHLPSSNLAVILRW